MNPKEQMRKRLEELIQREKDAQDEMKTIVRDYLLEAKKLPEELGKDDIAYRKVMREEFNLVV
jgi:hypothetical protein